MKASELRIGNYIWLSDKGKVWEILDGYEIDKADENPFVEAIPLTSEWLLKFGCVKLGPNWWGTPNALQFNFNEDNHCGLICFGPRHVHFWYVHTLQNIAALTGEELTIKDDGKKEGKEEKADREVAPRNMGS